MKKFSRYLLAAAFAMVVASPILSVASPVQPTASAANCEPRFLGIPPWYRGVVKEEKDPSSGDTNCVIMSPAEVSGSSDQKGWGEIGDFVWLVVLNVVEMAMVIIAYVAVFFIIYGGFQFIAGGSNPSTVAKARQTILNAVIGLVVALGAVAITNYIFGVFDGATGGARINGTDTGIQKITSEQLLNNILNIVYFVVGTLAVVVAVISGLMYTISGGDASRVAKAKNMLVYSIVGLIIAISAYAITNFVIGRFQ